MSKSSYDLINFPSNISIYNTGVAAKQSHNINISITGALNF
jgi:hypothetical protein